MMNYIWPLMIIFSLFCAIATGNTDKLSSSIIGSSADAIALIIKIAGIICMWNGIVEIAEKSNLTKVLCKILNPFLKLIFPTLKDEKARELISMNITANLLGLDNAATPLGLQAMRRLQESNNNSRTANNNMVRFVVINTASIHLVPTTVAMLRQEYGSASPTEILLPALLTSIIALTVGLIMTNILKRCFNE